MRALGSLALVLGMAFGPTVGGLAPASSKDQTPTLEQLINQLGDKTHRVREKAARAILARGKESLPALIKARTHPDAEVRRRLEELIPPLERAVALTPKRVTLHMENKPMADILKELGKQSGYQILGGPGSPAGPQPGPATPTARVMRKMAAVAVAVNTVAKAAPPTTQPKVAPAPTKPVGPTYTFDFTDVAFWEAFDKVCDAGGLFLQSINDNTVQIGQQDMYVPYYCYDGPFKIIATGFNYNRNVDFSQLPRNPVGPTGNGYEWLQLSIMVSAEPKLPILKIGQVKLLEAVDEEHNSMIAKGDPDGYGPFGWQWRGYSYWNRGFQQGTQLPLVWTSKTAKTVKRLRGLLPVTILADTKPTVVTEDLAGAKGKKFKVGNTTIQVEDVTGSPGKPYQIKLSLTEDSKDNPYDWGRMQSMQQRIEIQDAKGAKQQFYFNSQSWGGNMSVQFQLTVNSTGPKSPPPAKLVFQNWVLMEHEVAFDFKDLPLP
jgi:hypothetical protein